MKADELARILSEYRWSLLNRMYGCAHSSIIGFISTEWISQSKDYSIIDGAPSPIIGKKRIGQKNADVLLCKRKAPFIVVEVETNVVKYHAKIDTITEYLHNDKQFKGIEAGILFMTNLTKGETKYKHNWIDVKSRIKNMGHCIALVSIEKRRMDQDNSTLGLIRNRNDYSPWDIVSVDYWIHDENHTIVDGIFWKPEQIVV